ncbi:hypothetical protein DITRI_Ditri02bG0091200 [Diplodiscus trichospermus]
MDGLNLKNPEMASKQATVAFAVFLMYLGLSSGNEVCGQSSSDCQFIEENCKNNVDCDIICSANSFNSGGVCAPNNTGSTHCCCIDEDCQFLIYLFSVDKKKMKTSTVNPRSPRISEIFSLESCSAKWNYDVIKSGFLINYLINLMTS